MRGPQRVPIWGERREYTWYIRDGFFVRSPLKFNGVAIGEAERQKFEADFLKQAQERDKRAAAAAASSLDGGGITIQSGGSRPGHGAGDRHRAGRRRPDSADARAAVHLVRLFPALQVRRGQVRARRPRDARRPRGAAHRVLPRAHVRRHRSPPQPRKATSDEEKARDAEVQRLMNKVALVTLWVEPKAHQIVKYTFDNVGFDFLPAQWLVHVSDVKATMTVGPAVPGRLAAEQPGDQPGDDGRRRPVRRPLRRSTTTTTACPASPAKSASSSVTWASLLAMFLARGPQAVVAGEIVAAIQIQGNTATPDEEMRRLAGVQVGMPFDETTVDAVSARLRGGEEVRSVEVRKRFASIEDPDADRAGHRRGRRAGEDRHDRRSRSPDPRRPQDAAQHADPADPRP